MTPLLRALGLGVALMAGVILARASVFNMSVDASAAAVLRLAWTARPDRSETCRQPTESEQAAIPAHMRQAMICEGATSEYRLTVRRNGQAIADHIVRGGGLRHDRPLYVFHEFRLPAGDAIITVRLDRVGTPPISSNNAAPLRRDHADVVPASLLLERQFRFVAGDVVLVTYDPEQRALVAVEGSRP